MRLSRYGGNPNIGVFARANESLAFVACDAAPEFVRNLEEVLQVKTFMTALSGSFVIGSLMAMNSEGAVVSFLSDPEEVASIGKEIKVTVLDDPVNAAGNNILVNDRGAVINPNISRKGEKAIADALGVDVVRGTIAGCDTVGSVCCATNTGCICHADASDEDLALIRDVLKVEPMRASVNHGVRFVSAGVVANSKGALVGDETTPIEMGKIEDGLVLY